MINLEGISFSGFYGALIFLLFGAIIGDNVFIALGFVYSQGMKEISFK